MIFDIVFKNNKLKMKRGSDAFKKIKYREKSL